MPRIILFTMAMIVITGAVGVVLFFIMGMIERGFCAQSLNCGFALLLYAYPALLGIVVLVIGVILWRAIRA